MPTSSAPLLVDARPDLAAELDLTSIGGRDLDELTCGTGLRVWWTCSSCQHTWRASIANRAGLGSGCPACAGKVVHVDGSNSLAALHPDLAAEWHPDNPVTAAQVLPRSSKLVRWVCGSCAHEWETKVAKRTRGSGCAVCAGQVVHADGRNSLAALHPDLAAEWYEGNPVRPEEVRPRSGKRVRWSCSICQHEWVARVASRADGSGCPACVRAQPRTRGATLAEAKPELLGWLDDVAGDVGRKPLASRRIVAWRCPTCEHRFDRRVVEHVRNGQCPACTGRVPHSSGLGSVAVTHPELASEISDPTVDPSTLVPGSHRELNWTCSSCTYRWRTQVRYRTHNDSGCPACAGRVLRPDGSNSVAADPVLAAEWHPTRNDKPATSVLAGANQDAWWRCTTCAHEWSARVANRSSRKAGCPACSGMRGHSDGRNSLATLRPDLAALWHPDNEVSASQVTLGSNLKRRWRCTEGHVWERTVAQLVAREGSCPVCVPSWRSGEEIALARALAEHLDIDPDESAVVDGWPRPVDMVDHSRRLVIEWDGSYWHRDSEVRDRAKLDALMAAGWTMVRLREAPLEPVGPYDVVVPLGATTAQRTEAALDAVQRATEVGAVVDLRTCGPTTR